MDFAFIILKIKVYRLANQDNAEKDKKDNIIINRVIRLNFNIVTLYNYFMRIIAMRSKSKLVFNIFFIGFFNCLIITSF